MQTHFYEAMFVVDNDLALKNPEKAAGVIAGIIERFGGVVAYNQKWDERRLAYEIKGRRRATYQLTYFDAPIDAPPGISRQVELNDKVLRVLMLNKTREREALMEKIKTGDIQTAESADLRERRDPAGPPRSGGGRDSAPGHGRTPPAVNAPAEKAPAKDKEPAPAKETQPAPETAAEKPAASGE